MSAKLYIKKLLSGIGFEIFNKKLLEKADDSYFVLSKLLLDYEVRTIIDGGASIGSNSLKLANLFPKAFIHSIEPYPPFFQKLSEISKIQKRVKPHQLAFAEKNGTTHLKINKSEGTNSLLQNRLDSSAGFGKLLQNKGEIEVRSVTIDHFIESQFIEKVDILKLDLQGYELFAVEGCKKSLQQGKIKVILCEIIIDKLYENQPFGTTLIEKLVREFDFNFFNFFQPHHHHGRLIQFDALLIHSDLMVGVNNSSKESFHPYSKFPFQL